MKNVPGEMADNTWLTKQVFHGKPIGWPYRGEAESNGFFDFIEHHGLIPLIHKMVNQGDSAEVWPEQLRLRIRQSAHQEAAMEILRKRELESVLAMLAKAGIAPLLMKGTPLAYGLYPDPILRPRIDTDMLIAPDDSKKVVSLFNSLGYKQIFESSGEFHSSQTTFVKDEGIGSTHAYDLHWQISNNSRSFSKVLNYQYLVSRAEEVKSLGQEIITLNRIDALLLACFHRAGHFAMTGDRLIWLYDIHLLSCDLDARQFDEFWDQAARLKIRYLCADAMLTAREWFNTPVPEERLLHLRRVARDEISASLLVSGRVQGIRNRTRLELAGLTTPRDKLQYLWQQLFPSVNYMTWRYGIRSRFALPFFYLRRVVEGMGIFLRH